MSDTRVSDALHAIIHSVGNAHIYETACKSLPLALELEQQVESLHAERDSHAARFEGHGQPCHFCGRKINNLAGDPGEWAIAMPHAEEPGVIKWHHGSCIFERLTQRDAFLADKERLDLISSEDCVYFGRDDGDEDRWMLDLMSGPQVFGDTPRDCIDAARKPVSQEPLVTSTYGVTLCAACGGIKHNAYVIPSAEHACKCVPVSQEPAK